MKFLFTKKQPGENILISITLDEKTYLGMEERHYQAYIKTAFSSTRLSKMREKISVLDYLNIAKSQEETLALNNTILRPDLVRISVKERLDLAKVTANFDSKMLDQLSSHYVVLPLSIYNKLLDANHLESDTASVYSNGRASIAGASIAPSIATLKTSGMFSTATKAVSKEEQQAQKNVQNDIQKIVSPLRMEILMKLGRIPNTCGRENTILPQKKMALIIMRALIKDAVEETQPRGTMDIIQREILEICSSTETELQETVIGDITRKCRSSASLSDNRPEFSSLDLIMYLSDCILIYSKHPKYFLYTSTAALNKADSDLVTSFEEKRTFVIMQTLKRNISPKCYAYVEKMIELSSNSSFKIEALQFVSTLIDQTFRKGNSTFDAISTMKNRNNFSGEFSLQLAQIENMELATDDLIQECSVEQKIDFLKLFSHIFKNKNELLIPENSNIKAIKDIGKKWESLTKELEASLYNTRSLAS